MLRLLKDLCVDTREPVDAENPLRQVIVNTHSPSVEDLPDHKALLNELLKLPRRWATTFGGRCRPVSETRDWPDAALLRRLLGAQLDRMLVLLPQVAWEQLADPRRLPTTGWTLHDGLLHGLHDEARHQGEMYLLFKLCRAGRLQ